MNEEKLNLVLNIMPYVKSLASKIKRRYPRFLLEDLIGYGNLGLLKAVHKFDKSRNIKFKTFSYKFIWGSMMDHVRSEIFSSRVKKISVKKDMLEFKDEIFDDKNLLNNFDSPYYALCKKQARKLLLDKINSLPKQRRNIFYLEYYKELNLKDVAKRLKVTAGSIYSNKSFAMEKLRECEICNIAKEIMGEL